MSAKDNKRASATFQMFKDMETKTEFQKVKMAGFLRELHKLATEEAKSKLMSSMDQLPPAGGRRKSAAFGDGTMSVMGLDLEELKPEEALGKIKQLHKGGKLDSGSIVALAQAAVEVMSKEETVVDLKEKCPGLTKVTVVGDLHGSLECLMKVLKLVEIKTLADSSDRVVVFDGDFVDRGKHSLEVLMTLILLKLAHKDKVFLMRGNHEDSMTASTYGFREEVETKYDYEKGDEIWYEFGLLFASFPIISRSNSAAIMHGGIPQEDFDLDEVNELSPDVRCELKTIADPYDEDERLVQGILWSDPTDEMGLAMSDRGAGYTFGPDITKDFLDRHDLKFIIRAHEPFETGTNHHDCGDGRGVVTIFSTANYPEGEGTNHGAVLHLDDIAGTYETVSFIHHDDGEEADDKSAGGGSLGSKSAGGGYHHFLTKFIDDHRSKLANAFREKQTPAGTVTIEEWAKIIADVLELKDVPWLELQPDLAPTTKHDGNEIEWKRFLGTHSSIPNTDLLEQDQISLLHKHKDKFLNIFQLLDTDKSGTIDEEEFVNGIKMLNEETSGDMVVDNPAELFQMFDKDGGGEISIDEFVAALQESAALKCVAEKLDAGKVTALQENHEMLLVAFKYLDTDRSGAIDREEFQRGIDLLNKRLPERNKLGDPNELFELLDLDGNGEIGAFLWLQSFCFFMVMARTISFLISFLL